MKATAEASSSSPPGEEFDVEAELSTMNVVHWLDTVYLS